MKRILIYLSLCILALIFAINRALAHGAWLDVPTIEFTPATEAQIDANVAAGNGAILPGDIIELIASFDSIVDGTVSGPGGYFTFYVPNGTEVVGASVVDAALNDIPVRNGTSPVSGEGMPKGWGNKGQITFAAGPNGWNPSMLSPACTIYGYTAEDCNSGMGQLFGDTGLFYSTNTSTQFYTGDGSNLASLDNGYRINPSNNKPWASIGGNGDARVHNKWDAVQSNGFGSKAPLMNPGFTALEQTNLSDGRGTTPFLAGSPVAGPQSGMPLDRYGTTGPWNRISYPGACMATSGVDGPANSAGATDPDPQDNNLNSVAVCTPTPLGNTLSEANPLPTGTNAVRYAIGGIHEGQTYRIKVRFRVIDPALIKAFNAEASGADSTQGAENGQDNAWRYWVGGPGVAAPEVNSRLSVSKSIVKVNGQDYVAGSLIPEDATVTYRIGYANSGFTDQTNVILSDLLPAQTDSTSNFVLVSGPDILPASNPAGGTFDFQTIPLLPPGQGGGIEFDVDMSTVVGETVTNEAQLKSDEIPTPLISNVSADVRAIIVDFDAIKTVELFDPSGANPYAIPGQDVVYTFTVTNKGDPVDSGSISLVDAIPTTLVLFKGAFDGATAEPIKFVDGTGAAETMMLCCSDTDIAYSVDGVNYSYSAPSGYDAAITHIKIEPKGIMPEGITDNKEFELKFRAQIK